MSNTKDILNGWIETKYGFNPPVKCPLENGKWYEIGRWNEWGETFTHQGIKMFKNDNFFDGDYFLKPFPSHFKEIVLSESPIIFNNEEN